MNDSNTGQTNPTNNWNKEEYERLSDRWIGSYILLAVSSVSALLLIKGYKEHFACLLFAGIPYFFIRYLISHLRIAREKPIDRSRGYDRLHLTFTLTHSGLLAISGYVLCKQPHPLLNFTGFIAIITAFIAILITLRFYQLNWDGKKPE